MSQRSKSWFFDTPKTTSYGRLSQHNKPTESTFRDLLDSLTLKEEAGDTASESQQGLVKLCTDANAKSRTSASSGMQTLVRPHQLPMLIATGTTEIASGVSTNSTGISISGVSITSGSNSRLSYKIEFVPNVIATKATPTVADYGLITDTADSGTPKRVLLSTIAALAGGYWTVSGSEIYPSSAYTLKSTGDVYLDTASVSDTRYIYSKLAANDHGSPLHIHGCDGLGTAKSGGSLYIYPGAATGGGTSGNLYLCYNGTSAFGYMGIGGAVVGSNLISIHGNVYLNGKATIVTPGGGAITHFYGVNASGEITTRTPKEAGDTLVGATLAARAMLIFDGSAYSYLSTGSTIDKYLRVNSGGNLEFGDLDLAGKIVNTSVAAGAAISLSKLAVLTASRALVADGAGVISVSSVTSTELGYLAGATSSLQTQMDNISSKSSGNGIEYKTTDFLVATDNASWYIMNVTSNAIDAELPALSSVEIGDTRKFTTKFSSGSFAATISVSGGTGDAIKDNDLSEPTSITISGATGSSVTLVKRTSGYWEVMETIVLV